MFSFKIFEFEIVCRKRKTFYKKRQILNCFTQVFILVKDKCKKLINVCGNYNKISFITNMATLMQ